jgi:folate-binding protein YgfZ
MGRSADQYRIITAGAGWLERVDRGRLKFVGRDAAAFLQALLTNDVQSLARGQHLYAAYLTPQGRMIADMRVHHGGEFLLMQVAAALAPALAQRFDQLIFSEDVRVADVSDAVAQFSVLGPGAEAALAAVRELDAAMVAPADDVALPAFDVFVPVSARDALVSQLGQRGAVPVPADLFDALRIEAGRPAFGVDMAEDTIPLEAGLLERGISTTKGCYVGQEIIIRVLHRGGGRVARRLVKLKFEAPSAALPAPGTPLQFDGREVGRITSAAESPATGHIVGLGYVHRDQAETGIRVTTPEGASAEIVGFAG